MPAGAATPHPARRELVRGGSGLMLMGNGGKMQDCDASTSFTPRWQQHCLLPWSHGCEASLLGQFHMKLSERRHFQEEASHFPSNAVSCRWLLFTGWGMLLS